MADTPNLNISRGNAGLKLSAKLSNLEIQEKERQTEGQANQMGLSYINLHKFPVSQDALKIIEKEKAESLQTICFFYTGEEMRLGSLNPNNPQVANLKNELSDKYHTNVKMYLISENSFAEIFSVYDKIPQIIEVEGVQITEDDLKKFEKQIHNFSDLDKLIKKTNLTETINLIIATALNVEASDVHIEAEEKDVKIRLRVDGILHDVATLPREDWDKVNSRMKLLAGLKLNIGNKPQDGRFTITMTKSKVDVRVSTIPSTYGESIVMRLLTAKNIGLEFEDLGLRGKSFIDLKSEMAKPNGMILATGPTGSGKTTTLYAVLTKLNSPDTKIITLEDPVEYKLKGIVQSQVDSTETIAASEREGKAQAYSFARGLKAILRQDPDIVMVGEVRDLETAETAINAALTGHLMLSTLHTNSAAATIPRLLAIGVKPFLLAPSLNAIIGQRLVRRLCQHCKIPNEKIDNTTMTEAMNALNDISSKSGHKPDNLADLKFSSSKGCDKCHGLGYKGRVGIYEVLVLTNAIEKLILSGQVSENKIEKLAVSNGMVTMLQDGLLKALDGITSLEEIFKEVKD